MGAENSKTKALDMSIDDSNTEIHYMVGLLGDTASGKTTLMNYLVEEQPKSTPSSLGVDVRKHHYTVNGQRELVCFVDTVFHPNLRRLITSALRRALAVLVLYDVTSASSFQEMQRLLFFVQHYFECCPKILIVGTKCDLKDAITVPEQEVDLFARERGVQHVRFSVKDSSHTYLDFRRLLFPPTPSNYSATLNLSRVGGLLAIKTHIEGLMEQWSSPDISPQIAASSAPIQTAPMSQRAPPARKNAFLLYGAAQTGKMYALKETARSTGLLQFSYDVKFLLANITYSPYPASKEERVAHIFSLARRQSPCMLIIDSLDELCPPTGVGPPSNTFHDLETVRSVTLSLVREIRKHLVAAEARIGGADRVLVVGISKIPWLVPTLLYDVFPTRLYAPFPNDLTRLAIFRTQLPEISERELEVIVDSTALLTNFEIRDALDIIFESTLGWIQGATHVKPYATHWVPCQPSDENAEPIQPLHKLRLPPPSFQTIIRTIGQFPGTFDATFTRDYERNCTALFARDPP